MIRLLPLALVLACTDVPASNPFDPESPTSAQLPGSVAGSVVLPEGFEARRVEGARVELRAADAPAVVAADGEIDAEGAFLVEDLVPATYVLRVRHTGFTAESVTIVVGIAALIELGEIELSPVEDALLRGTALLRGAEDHFGLRVEAIDTPYATTARSDGSYQLQVAAGAYTLRFSAPGYAPTELEVSVDSEETKAVDEVTLEGEPGSLAGVVRLQPGFEDAERLASADLVLSRGEEVVWAGHPDAEGAFFVPDLPAAPYRLTVTLDTFYPETRETQLEVGAHRALELITLFSVLSDEPEDDAAAFITGSAQLAGAAEGRHGGIDVEAVGTPFVTRTSSEGQYELRVAGGARYALRFSAPSYDPQQVEDVAPEAGETLPIAAVTLQGQPGRIEGRVHLPDDFAARLQDVDLCVVASESLEAEETPAGRCAEGEVFQRGAPGAGGAFVFESVPAGAYVMAALLDGFAPVEPELEVHRGATSHLRIDLVPPPPTGVLTGIARLEGLGEGAHGGILVEAEGTPHNELTGSDGDYTLALPARAGGYALRFTSEGYNVERVIIDRLDRGQDLAVPEVTLSGQPGRVRGIVSIVPLADGDFDPAQFLPEVVVELFAFGDEGVQGEPLRQTNPDPERNGLYLFDDVPAGDYQVHVRLAGFRDENEIFNVGLGETRLVPQVDLRSLVAQEEVPPSFIRGRALLDCVGDCDHAGTVVEAVGTPFVAITGQQGHFELEVAARDYRLRYSHAGFTPLLSGQVAVDEEQIVVVDDVVLAKLPAALSGRVQRRGPDEALLPAAGAVIAVLDGEDVVATTPTDETGAFFLADLNGGAYTLRASLEGHVGAQRPVRLVAGEVTAAGLLELDLLRGAIRGRVRRAEGATGAITIEVQGDAADPGTRDVRRVVGVADPGGAFLIDRLPVGAYALAAVAPGHRPADPGWSGAVEVDAEAQVEVVLQPRAASLELALWSGAGVTATLRGDEDATRYQAWWGAAPEDLEWQPLPADGRVALPAPAPGPQVLSARLANDALFAEDPHSQLLAWASEVLTANTTYDLTGPVATLRAPPVSGGRDVLVEASCADDHAPAGLLRALVEGEVEAYDGPPSQALALRLVGGDGPRQLTLVCHDPAGNAGAPAALQVELDTTPPSITSLVLAEGAAFSASHIVSLEIDSADVGSGVVGTAISENPALDCASADYAHPAAGDLVRGLSPGEGPRRLYACAKDAAGHVSERAQSNAVTLDTVPPEAGTLSLAGGAAYATSAAVAISIDSNEQGLQLRLSGPIQEAGERALAALPAQVVLTGGVGEKRVEAVLIDAAGNESPVFADGLHFDDEAPHAVGVRLAEDRALVNTRVVPVSTTPGAEEPDLMRFWVVAGGQPCGAASCGQGVYEGFARATTVTLPEPAGDKQVCWHFCDLAGNGTVVGGRALELGRYTQRPVPVLEAVDPPRYVAFTRESYPLTLSGRGIAGDTRAQIGELVLPCVSVDAADCEADADGGCGAGQACAASCASECEVDLPPAIVGRAGTYPVRLLTTEPVADGVGRSVEVEFFDLVAPLPSIANISPRGVVQRLDPDGNPEAQTLRVTVTGRGFMDNAQFRLGDNIGEIVGDIQADGEGLQTALVEVSTAGLTPSEFTDSAVFAINPAPGGGARAKPFGINPERVGCPSDESACVSNLRWTRAAMPDGRGVFQDYSVEGLSLVSGVSVAGSDAAQLRDDEGGLGRYEGASFALPPFAPQPHLRLESARGRNPQVAIRRASVASSTSFEARVTFDVPPPGPFELAAADLDLDGDLELISGQVGTVAIYPWEGAGFGAPSLLPADGREGVAVADLDADGAPDLIAVGEGLSLLFGRGDGTFEATVDLPLPGVEDLAGLAVADVNGDGAPDIIVGHDSGSGASLRLNLHQRRFAPAVPVGEGAIRTHSLALGDLDGDGAADLAFTNRWNNRLYLRLGDGQGGWAASTTHPTGSGPDGIAFGDLDGDGAVDVVVANESSDNLSVFYGDGAGGLAAPELVAMGDRPVRPQLVDLNADGWLDLVVGRAGYSGQLAHRLTLGPRSFGDLAGTNGGGQLADMILADFDGDGALDAGAAVLRGDLHFHKGRGGATMGDRGLAPDMTGELSAVAVGDLDGDGWPDLIGQSNGTHWLYPWLNQGGSFVAQPRFQGRSGASLALEDLNGDGVLDLVAAGGSSFIPGFFHWFLGVGDGTFGAPNILQTGAEPEDLVLGDLDGDGLLDAIVVNLRDDNVSVFRQTGPGVFGAAVALAMGDGARGVALGDLNEDGDLDLVSADSAEDAVSVRLGAAGAGFGARQSHGVGDDPWVVELVDVDLDGHLDLLTADRLDGRITLRAGAGDGTFGAIQPFPMGDFTARMRVIDLNGDGWPDLLARVIQGDAELAFRAGGPEGFGPVVLRRLSGAEGLSPSFRAFGDFNQDGVDDLAFSGRGAVLWTLPGSVGAAQTLRELPSATVPIQPNAENTFALRQAGQFVEHLAVRVRFEGQGLDQLRLTLRAPSGQEVLLDATASELAHYTAGGVAALATMTQRWQPLGEWSLLVQAGAGASAALRDFAVITKGQAVRRTCAWVDAAEDVAQIAGETYTLTGSTVGAQKRHAASCEASTWQAEDYTFSFTAPRTATWRFNSSSSGFDTVLTARRSCRAGHLEEIACDADGGAGPRARLDVPLVAGETVYIVLDGENARGNFQVVVSPR